MPSCVARGAVRGRVVMPPLWRKLWLPSLKPSALHLSLELSIVLIFAAMVSLATSVADTSDDNLAENEIKFTPTRHAYSFGRDSLEMVCTYRPIRRAPENTVLRVSNIHVQGILAWAPVDPVLGASIRFRIKSITSSSKFSCNVFSRNSPMYLEIALAQVFVLVDGPATCSTDKQCWGYGRNVICDNGASQRCMCSIGTARTSSDSPICTEILTFDKCKRFSCTDETDDCMCIQESTIIITDPPRYRVKNIWDAQVNRDEVAILNGSTVTEVKYIEREYRECIRCYQVSPGLKKIQLGLFLGGAILAFTAVTVMAVVIRKMWLYYRIPPHLLEVSRDLERETIEHEAAQMAQRDKPPSYIEVMEGDLRVSGYPPPDYEELSSIFRQQQRGCDNASGNPGLNPNPFNRRQQSIPSRPQSSQRLRFMTWYRTSTFSASSDITNSTLTSTAARPRPEISSVYSIPAGTNSPHSDAQPPTYEEASERARY